MPFASSTYWIFFLMVLSIVWILPRYQRRWTRNIVLLIFSYIFYGWVSTDALILLIFSTTMNFIFGEFIVSSQPTQRRQWMWLGIGFNIGLLGVFKYLDFFRQSIENVTFALGFNIHWPIIELLLPVGISFYTFQAIGYIVDLYKGHGVRANTLIDFALFQAFFPQILIGPICRSVDLLPQIHTEPTSLFPQINQAGWLILSGLFKQLFVATLLFNNGSMEVFSSPTTYSMWGLWGGLFGYSIQLYCDFSGYTDIARGSALLLGFDIPDNFRQPYAATNVGDFWQRWHITFSQWLRDYIYIPLGGSKGTANRTSWNLFLTFLICGLWHGASWGFVIWGGLHGIALAIHKRKRDKLRKRGINPKQSPVGIHFWWAWGATFTFIALSRVFFVCPNLDVSMIFIERLIDFNSTGLGSKITLIYAIILGWIMNLYGHDFYAAITNQTQRFTKFGQTISLGMLFVLLLLLRPGGVAPTLYFQF